MCSRLDNLIIGFNNGVLIVFDCEKTEIIFSHKNFTKNDSPIQALKLFDQQDLQTPLLFCLSENMLSYHSYPQISFIGEILEEDDIIAFTPYEHR